MLANVLGDLDVTLAQTGETAVTDLDRSNLVRADRWLRRSGRHPGCTGER